MQVPSFVDEKERQAAFMSALTTEHFVLQTAASGTITDASARSSLYLFSLSSSLVAIGFTSSSRFFMPFVAGVLPALFLLGAFTIMRLVDSALENMQYLAAIARIRAYYRTLGPDAAYLFAATAGRWPEAPSTPPLRLGPRVALFSTTACMIAFVNNIVAGAGVALLANVLFLGHHIALALLLGVIAAAMLMLVFLAYQRWRFRILELPPPFEGRAGPAPRESDETDAKGPASGVARR